jgi:hypothetical protein
MSGVRDRHPDRAPETHSETDLTPDALGPVNFAFGKEALLTLYTAIREAEHQAVIDYVFSEAKRRNAGVFTMSHVFAEVVGTVSERKGAAGVAQLWNDIEDSDMYVLHGARSWENPHAGAGEKSIAEAVAGLCEAHDSIGVKFHEATLVLDAVRLEAERESETMYVISLDGKLTHLAWSEGLNVLLKRTDLRNDPPRSGSR